ncbi:tRNA dihydrouridine(20/20a) synthase DusA [Enterobacteriaceae endosymbiont of Neohaemonia nigricornis]|uniref:tRNA dihydrouridine(20/20a) synthase DusA n=1 Tax=Enterobacteriaceae endosymbiont of Neohaemonia nigricornis TaxID=2675792 RepID=UPI001449F76B|nr:tRNA dihydrouridine(20/20a) synthase DusA [Enterobacteriaceae endosymbiont of Neohaemonia nigricornis]QJC30244.1 tRNA dihydrouridine(20/20a) synthase DusA [Enterobacteriaceae endosymbiont of Neohaemonia nigricornis]
MNFNKKINYYRFEIAPMLNRTNKYCRLFYRFLTKKSLLYTEMIHCNTITYNKNILLTNYHDNNMVLQLAGNNPKLLSLYSKYAEKIGYKEINLNMGCPSIGSQKGNFGAYLMHNLHIVINCIKSMSDSVNIPITIKTRIGINEDNSYIFLNELIDSLYNNGCQRFIIHARKALLYNNKITTKQNFKIPSLNYKVVYQIKKNFPKVPITINGGIKTLIDVQKHLKYFDGVMLGREIFNNPRLLTYIDKNIFFDSTNNIHPVKIIQSIFPYIETELKKGVSFYTIIKPILNFFHGMSGSKKFKHYINNKNNYMKNTSIQVLNKALSYIK